MRFSIEKPTTRVALLLAACFALAFIATRPRDEELRQRDPSPTSPSEARARSHASRRAATSRRLHGWDDVRGASYAREEEDAPPPDASLPMRPAPLAAEQGHLAESYARWARGHDAPSATRDVLAHLTTMLGDFDVETSDVRVSCTEALCRAELAFDSTEAVRKMSAVPYDVERVRLGSVHDERGVRVVAYWDRDGEAPF